jgi:hypothetical protein
MIVRSGEVDRAPEPTARRSARRRLDRRQLVPAPRTPTLPPLAGTELGWSVVVSDFGYVQDLCLDLHELGVEHVVDLDSINTKTSGLAQTLLDRAGD